MIKKDELEIQVLTLKAVRTAIKGQIGEKDMDTFTLQSLIKSVSMLIDIYEEQMVRDKKHRVIC